MKTIFNKFPKDKINDLPRALFEGRIEVVQSEAEAEKALQVLSRASIIGIDTETKPVFQPRSRQNKVALLQLSTHEVCFLFRLNMIGLTPGLTELLSDENILKVGLSLHDDFMKLKQLRRFSPAGYVELQDYITKFGVQDLSLQKLYANILGGRISKGQQLTNWEADTLTDQQKGYAATDAWACIMLYEALNQLRAEGFHVNYDPEEVDAPVVVTMAATLKKEESNKKKRKSGEANDVEET
ncbi:MAG: 3'-5' exonuclease domain-containing protein 2, partial [Bacteroidaceae bacterium]|nr:3'-5' exonuclease domain-containing protein 2 [Bacteroidaceae bacterium]MCF0196236.1 3'-5' exonuclease domain-containing protein 2 [Bacteroidaceae bacterium]